MRKFKRGVYKLKRGESFLRPAEFGQSLVGAWKTMHDGCCLSARDVRPVPNWAAIRTNIVCTIGPATANKEMIKQMTEAGMAIARFNFSHGDYEV